VEWQGSWSVIRDHLFFGVGTSGWKVALLNFYSNYNSSVAGQMLNSHNQFLQVWMENGILALIVFLFCVFGFVFRSTDRKYVVFILIFSLMCMTESVLEWQKGIVFFTMFQTLFLALEIRTKETFTGEYENGLAPRYLSEFLKTYSGRK
jgi:O-antigen ligase